MSYSYLLASVLVGWLTFHYGAMAMPTWLAGIAAFFATCLVVFLGIVRNELSRSGTREEWLHAGAIERRRRRRRVD